jgi:hypothetical protein
MIDLADADDDERKKEGPGEGPANLFILIPSPTLPRPVVTTVCNHHNGTRSNDRLLAG